MRFDSFRISTDEFLLESVTGHLKSRVRMFIALLPVFSSCSIWWQLRGITKVRAIVEIWSSAASFSFCTVFLLWFARFLASRFSATWSSMMFHVVSSCPACVSISPMFFVPVTGTQDDQQMWFVAGDTVSTSLVSASVTPAGQLICVITNCFVNRVDSLFCRVLTVWYSQLLYLTVQNGGCRPTRLNSTRRPLFFLGDHPLTFLLLEVEHAGLGLVLVVWTCFAPTKRARLHSTLQISSRSSRGEKLQSKIVVVCTAGFEADPTRSRCH